MAALTIVGALAAIGGGMLVGGIPGAKPEAAMLSTTDHQDPEGIASQRRRSVAVDPRDVSDKPMEALVVLPHGDSANPGEKGQCGGGASNPRPASNSTGWPAWASTSGSADLHAFADEPTGPVRYVAFLYVSWDKRGRAALRRTSGAVWRQTLSVDLPADAPVFRIEHWTSDLPGACLDAWVTGRTLTISVSVHDPPTARPGRRYGTQMLATSSASLTGQPWSYQEELAGGPLRRPGEGTSRWLSPPRSGSVDTCGTCYASWAVR